MRRVEVSQVVRRKLLKLKKDLAARYGNDFSHRMIQELGAAMSSLAKYPEMGVEVSKLYSIATDYRYLYRKPYYLIYRFDDTCVIIMQLFHERQNFIAQLFGEPEYKIR